MNAPSHVSARRMIYRIMASTCLLAAGSLGGVAFGASPHSAAMKPSGLLAVSSPRMIYTTPVTSENTALRWSTSMPPQLVIDRRTPIILTTITRQLVLFRYLQNRWQRTTVMTVPSNQTIDGDSIWCGSQRCWIALTTTSPRAPSARLRVLQSPLSAWHWTTRWSAPVSASTTGGRLQITRNGSTLWVLSTGTPAAGLMPKQLWSSPNGGASWSLIATDFGQSTGPLLHLPAGYPTGITAISPNHLIVTLQAPSTALTAVSYTLHPRVVHVLPFPTPLNVQWTTALPALVSGSTVTIPLMGLSQGVKSVLMIATRKSSHSVWTLHSISALPGGSATTESGNMDVLSGTTHLDVVWPDGHVVQLPELKSFPNPLVTAAMGSHLVVLGKDKSLWVNSHAGWRKW